MSRFAPGMQLIVCAAAVAVCGWVVSQTILSGVFPEVTMYRDDAYYYFEWARNLALGRGPVVGAGAATSGLNPLWGLVLTVVSWVFGADSVVGAARWLGLGCHLLTGLVLASCVRGSGFLRVAVACCYLSTPALMIEAQNGQATAVGCLCLALLIRYRHASGQVFVALAVCVLATRSDLIFFVVPLALLRESSLPARARLVVLPLCLYALWNVLLADHPLQDSARPMPWLFTELFAVSGPSLPDYLRRYWWFGRPSLLGGPFAVDSMVASAVIYAVALVPWLHGRWRLLPAGATALAWAIGMEDLQVPLLVAVLVWLRPSDDGRAPRLALGLGIGAIVLVFVHGVVRFYPRDYYYAPIAVAGFAVLAVSRWERAPWLVLVLALAANTMQVFDGAPVRAWQQSMAMAGAFVSRIVPAGDVIGCFNSGIVSWHHPGLVLNLDGVVNRPAFDALRSGRLEAYLDQKGVHWLLDNPVQFQTELVPHANGRHFATGFDPERDLTLVASFVVPGIDAGRPGTDAFQLYWRRKAGAMPPRSIATEDLGAAPVGFGHYVQWRGREGVPLRVVGGGQSQGLVTGREGVTFIVCVPASFGSEFALYEGDASEPVLRVYN